MIRLNLVDKFLLLALDDDKGTFASEPFAMTYGLAGALLLELSLKECVSIENKKVILKRKKRTEDVFLDTYLELIANSKKVRTLMHWVQAFGNKERKIKKEILEKLISKGILVKREEKFLWVFNNDKFPTVNSKPENMLRKRLYEIIENLRKPEVDELMLISLIDTCNLNRTIYGKERSNKCKSNIKEIIQDAKHNNSISSTIKEVHDIILAMIVVIITTSTTAATMSSN
ncbi:GOLPH3/VPS74 family protein [Urechidicola vernalis]|uniref:GPP34 family phosphoprotein n=1 Tax=Urechidicola vernalis TaxID=3075600 RepID=A0ABU2Y1A1_9FLAO|nr:GPP34 family phosphoprotein [Urechidicola sp. P050]MDT0551963.1 GPP34 family phosphoprotein [Urechidicola sp. P050]